MANPTVESRLVTVSEFEQKAQELISMMFKVTEARMASRKSDVNTINNALTISSLALEKAIMTFLAVARISE